MMIPFGPLSQLHCELGQAAFTIGSRHIPGSSSVSNSVVVAILESGKANIRLFQVLRWG